jgi:hypothetical protein
MLNEFETDVVSTVRSSREGFPSDIMGKKLSNEEVAVFFRIELLPLKCTVKRDFCLLSSIHDEEMQTVCDRKSGGKQKLSVCIDNSDAMGSIYLCGIQHVRKRMKYYHQKVFHHLLDLMVFSFL